MREPDLVLEGGCGPPLLFGECGEAAAEEAEELGRAGRRDAQGSWWVEGEVGVQDMQGPVREVELRGRDVAGRVLVSSIEVAEAS